MTVVPESRRRPVEPEPVVNVWGPALPGWPEGVKPNSDKMLAGFCLLCPARFETPDALLDHLCAGLEGREGHYVARSTPGRKSAPEDEHAAPTVPATVECPRCYGEFVSEHALKQHEHECDRTMTFAITSARRSGLSIRQTAKALGISPSAVQRVEARRPNRGAA